MNRRTGVDCAALLCFAVLVGCSSVPINKNDSSKPEVTLKVEGLNGYEEKASEDHGNSSSAPPINVMCVVEDPEGVRELDLEVSTIADIYCGATLHHGSFKIEGLFDPGPISVSSSEAPTTLTNILIVPGGVLFTTKPSNEPGPCSPANNTHITIRCTGKNWSSNAAFSANDTSLQINF